MSLRKKIAAAFVVALAACVTAVSGLTGCGGASVPGNFTFDRASRAYSFDSVDGATSYQISVNKVLNETTGRSMSSDGLAYILREERGQTITQYANTAAELATMPGSDESEYLWTSFIANTLVTDIEQDGDVSGTLSIYRYQTRADGVTPVLLSGDPEELPLGSYYITCRAVDGEGKTSDPAWQRSTVGGTLKSPEFSWSVENGKMTIAIGSTYIDDAMRYDGLPSSVEVTVDDGSGSSQTVVFDDWAYYATTIGPDTSYNYMFLEKEIDVADADEYTLTAVAKGDGGEVKDSSEVSLTDGAEGGNVTSSGGPGGGPGGPPPM